MSDRSTSLDADAYERLKGQLQRLSSKNSTKSPSQQSTSTFSSHLEQQGATSPSKRSEIARIDNTASANREGLHNDDDIASWVNQKNSPKESKEDEANKDMCKSPKASSKEEKISLTLSPPPPLRPTQSDNEEGEAHQNSPSFLERKELKELCSSLEGRLMKLFQQYELKYTAQSVLSPHIHNIEAHMVQTYSHWTRQIAQLTRERDENKKKHEEEALRREQETRDLKLQSADKLARLRLAHKRAIDKAVAEAQANVADTNTKLTESKIAEAERATETRVQRELAKAKAVSDAKLEAQLEELERSIEQLSMNRAEELKQAEDDVRSLRSRTLHLEQELESQKRKSQVQILGLEASIKESEAAKARFSERLNEALEHHKLERNTLLQRIEQQSEASEQRYKATLLESSEKLSHLKAAHQEELDQINIRVRHLVHKKDDQIRQLQEKVDKLEKGIAELTSIK